MERVTPGVVQIIAPDGAGTGFVIASDGRIVTNEHVVGRYKTVTVRIPGVGSYNGRVLGVDAIADLAIVDIDDSIPFMVLDMGDSDDISIGEDVVAVGFPLDDMLGENPTITRGVASSIREYDGVEHIQTDAAINPGNSGGPLFNGAGEVIGVNTSTIEEVDGRIIDGVSFAVAINEVKERLPSLSAGESVGITPTPTPMPSPRGSSGTFSLEIGELPHDDDGRIESITAFRDVRNFSITANFEVPYSEGVGDWSVGFIFRYPVAGDLSYVAVTQSGWYNHKIRRDGERSTLDSGYVPTWNRSVGNKNKITLVVVEDRGWLFVNSDFVTDLDVSGASEQGSLQVATGFFTGDEVEGETTRISAVSATALEKDHGPTSGSLSKDDGLQAGKNYALVDLRGAYASVEFRTPAYSSEWFVGLGFKHSVDKSLMFVVGYFETGGVGSGVWTLTQWMNEDWQALEVSHNTDVSRSSNRLEIFYTDSVAIMYLNGEKLERTDVSAYTQSGSVWLYSDSLLEPAHYENFVVYGLPPD